MRLIDADMGREKLQEIYNAWNLAMAPAEGREIAYVDKKMRLCELMIKFLDQLPTIPPTPNDPLTLEQLREMDGSRCGVNLNIGRMDLDGSSLTLRHCSRMNLLQSEENGESLAPESIQVIGWPIATSRRRSACRGWRFGWRSHERSPEVPRGQVVSVGMEERRNQ